ncbi:MAG TPA: thermonuclease family protein [Nitrospiria bacterium]|nr:thermonuclease family protein [Nitrospiria bacterium]
MPFEKPARLHFCRLTRFLIIPLFFWIVLGFPSGLFAQTSLPGVDGPVLVIRVIDGDTIELKGGERVRYLGIDAPERHRRIQGRWVGVEEPFSEEAYVFNRERVEGKGVRLEFDREIRDHYRRLLAYVFVGDEMINEELIEAGLVRVRIHPPNFRYKDIFKQAEQKARLEGMGLWREFNERGNGGVADDQTIRRK